MKPATRWIGWTLGGLLAVAGAIALAFAVLVPDNDELAARVASRAEAKLGVKVTVGAVHWELLPPTLVVEDAATVQPQPIAFKRLAARFSIGDLLRGQVRLTQLLVDGAVLPQLSLRSLKIQPEPADTGNHGPLVEQLVFRNLTWITRHGRELEFDGHASFDTAGLPDHVEVMRTGGQPPVQFTLAREGQDDRWQFRLLLGGGTAHGYIAIVTRSDGTQLLSGELEPRGVEVADAMASFKRNSALRGKASGRTLLSASGTGVGELARSLHTQTRFSMAPATLLRLDVDKAIRSAGQSRDGQTTLRSLTGRMDTQNTANGIEVRYSAIEAQGESFSASGGGSIINRRIDAEVTVDLVGGLIGVPLKVNGPLAEPKVSVALPAGSVPGATIGAVVGTAVLPGVGTAIGAGVGAAIGKIFGAEKPKDAAR